MKKYALFAGVDISKGWVDISLTLDGQKSSMPHRRFSNSPVALSRIPNWIRGQFTGIPQDKWVFCMEHTGVYGYPLMAFLEERGLDQVVESALHIKRCLGLSRGKDDKADSRAIARYAYLYREELQISQLPGRVLLRIKNLLSLRTRLVRQLNALKVAFQEARSFQGEELTRDIEQPTRELVRHMQLEVQRMEKQVLQLIQEDPGLKQIYDLVTSVKGIGLICAANLIVATNAFEAFANWRKFACYIGIAPFKHQSGSAVNRPNRVSQLGHKVLKALLTNAAMSAIQHDRELKTYYQRKVGEGKSKYSVFNAIKNKLVSRVFATVKRGTPFVELHAYV